MDCNCGCRQETSGGLFKPGHDQKLRADLERRANGLLTVRDLVDISLKFAHGEVSDKDFALKVRELFSPKY